MDYFDEAVNCLRELIGIDSVQSAPAAGAPFGKGVREALDYMLSVMEKAGFRTFVNDGYYGYAEIGSADKPLFGVLNHLDVVPVTEGWSHDPFGGEIDGGCIWGRGAEDDKGPAVAAFFAAKELLDEGRVPKVRLRFILGTNEESGWKCMDKYKANEEMPETGFSPDADFPVINCEKGVAFYNVRMPLPEGIVSVTSGTRANIVPDYAEALVKSSGYTTSAAEKAGAECSASDGMTKIVTHGVSAHGSSPRSGVNALVGLLTALGAANPDIKKLADALGKSDGSGSGLACSDKESGALTLNAGAARTVNGVLSLDLDIRHPVTVKRDDVTAKLAAALPYAEVSLVSYHDPLFVPKDHPLVRGLLEAYRKVTGDKDAEPISIGGATYARVLPVGVGFGPVFPGEKSYIHMRDERLPLESFRKMKAVYKEALSLLCFE